MAKKTKNPVPVGSPLSMTFWGWRGSKASGHMSDMPGTARYKKSRANKEVQLSKKKKTKVHNITRTETVEEFLARGGKIQKIEPVIQEENEVNVKQTVVGPANLMSKSSNPFSIDHMSKEEFEEALKKIDGLTDKQKEKLMDMAENMSELSYQSPGLEEAALMYGDKTKRKKKAKSVDKKEMNNHIDELLKHSPESKWLIDELKK